MIPLAIAIHDDDRRLERRTCALRRTPDGRLGALCEGVVLPLAPGPRVDLAGPWFYPDDCPLLLEPPGDLDTLLAEQAADWWHLDVSGHFPYVFVDVDEPRTKHAAAVLRAAGLAVTRTGPAFRPADNGRFYRSFVRLESASATTLPRAVIATALADFEQAAGTSAPIEFPTDPHWRDRAQAAERDLAMREEELAVARAALAHLGEAAERQRRHLEDDGKLLHAALTAARDRLAALEQRHQDLATTLAQSQARLAEAGVPVAADELARLQTDLEVAMALWSETSAKAMEADEQVARWRAKAEALESALAEAKHASDARAARVASRPPRLTGRKREELETIAAVLLPRVRLLPGSADFIATEVFDWHDLLQDLALLNAPGVQLRGKPLRGCTGWWEKHFSTGQSDDGRLYWRDTQGLWEVLVSDKAAQNGDIERLRKL